MELVLGRFDLAVRGRGQHRHVHHGLRSHVSRGLSIYLRPSRSLEEEDVSVGFQIVRAVSSIRFDTDIDPFEEGCDLIAETGRDLPRRADIERESLRKLGNPNARNLLVAEDLVDLREQRGTHCSRRGEEFRREEERRFDSAFRLRVPAKQPAIRGQFLGAGVQYVAQAVQGGRDRGDVG